MLLQTWQLLSQPTTRVSIFSLMEKSIQDNSSWSYFSHVAYTSFSLPQLWSSNERKCFWDLVWFGDVFLQLMLFNSNWYLLPPKQKLVIIQHTGWLKLTKFAFWIEIKVLEAGEWWTNIFHGYRTSRLWYHKRKEKIRKNEYIYDIIKCT